jgi:succinyl-diaminopimelate desuccinylase
VEQKIDQWIENHTDEMVATLQGAIRIPSVLDEEAADTPFGQDIRAALTYFLDAGRRMGFSVTDIEGYAGVIEWGTGEPRLGILVHTDVVPAGDGWTYPPFGGEVHDGRIYGRGVMDDKGPAVSVLYAMAALRDAGFAPKGTVQLIIGTDEETEHRGLDRYLEERPAPHFGFSPDGEFPVIHGEKGIIHLALVETDPYDDFIQSVEGGHRPNMVPETCTCWFTRGLTMEEADRIGSIARDMMAENDWELDGDTLTIRGIAAHGSMPEKGINAIGRLLVLLDKAGLLPEGGLISMLAKRVGLSYDGEAMGLDFSDEATGHLTLNLGEIHINATERRAVLDIRYPATKSGEDVLAILSEKAAEAGVALKVRIHHLPLYMEKDSDIVQALLGVYRDVTKDMKEPFTIGGGTYAREIPNAVAFGPLFPGRPDVMHQKDEYFPIEDLVQTTRIYARAIRTLMAG